MNEKINILITGACGVTSRSIVRSIEMSEIFQGKCNFIGTDVCYNKYGIYEGLYSKVYKVPYTDDNNYYSIMERIIKEEKIKAAFIIPELEAVYWSEHKFSTKYMAIPKEFAKIAISKKSVYDVLSKYDPNIVPSYEILSRK